MVVAAQSGLIPDSSDSYSLSFVIKIRFGGERQIINKNGGGGMGGMGGGMGVETKCLGLSGE